jgi:hypothetical protein
MYQGVHIPACTHTHKQTNNAPAKKRVSILPKFDDFLVNNAFLSQQAIVQQASRAHINLTISSLRFDQSFTRIRVSGAGLSLFGCPVYCIPEYCISVNHCVARAVI